MAEIVLDRVTKSYPDGATAVKVALPHGRLELRSILCRHHVVMPAEVERASAFTVCPDDAWTIAGRIERAHSEAQLAEVATDQRRTRRVSLTCRVLARNPDELRRELHEVRPVALQATANARRQRGIAARTCWRHEGWLAQRDRSSSVEATRGGVPAATKRANSKRVRSSSQTARSSLPPAESTSVRLAGMPNDP